LRALKRRFVIGAAVTTLVVVAATAAEAATWRTTSALSTSGAKTSTIYYRFQPWPCTSDCVGGQNSGMVVSTSLYDTSDDGYSVKLQGKIDGYGYTLLGTAKSTNSPVSVNKVVYKYDPAQSGKVELCRDKGILPDNCVTTPTLYR